MGISHVPEGRELFAELSVMENLRLGAYTRNDGAAIKQDIKRVVGYFPILGERSEQKAGSLSGGEQQQLAIARALMSRPRLLMLDEPSLGLAPLVVRGIFQIIKAINKEEGVTILLVEQDATIALNTAAFGYVLETGRVVMSGKASDVKSDEAIRKSYLGY